MMPPGRLNAFGLFSRTQRTSYGRSRFIYGVSREQIISNRAETEGSAIRSHRSSTCRATLAPSWTSFAGSGSAAGETVARQSRKTQTKRKSPRRLRPDASGRAGISLHRLSGMLHRDHLLSQIGHNGLKLVLNILFLLKQTGCKRSHRPRERLISSYSGRPTFERTAFQKSSDSRPQSTERVRASSSHSSVIFSCAAFSSAARRLALVLRFAF